jgi:hypothetical protein
VKTGLGRPVSGLISHLSHRADGPTWDKIVSGRPWPPLAFAASGNKVAYFEMARGGDRLVVADIR